MYWRKVVIPPNKESYLKSCALLKRYLDSKKPMPPVIIAGSCWYVLRDAFGGELKSLKWVSLSIAQRHWEHFKADAWYFWQKLIRRKSEKQIQKLLNERVKRSIRVDLDECAKRVGEAEFEEWLESMLREEQNDDQ